MLQTHALALSADHFFYARQSPYEYVHSVRIELAKFILVGTRITYQATGDPLSFVNEQLGVMYAQQLLVVTSMVGYPRAY